MRTTSFEDSIHASPTNRRLPRSYPMPPHLAPSFSIKLMPLLITSTRPPPIIADEAAMKFYFLRTKKSSMAFAFSTVVEPGGSTDATFLDSGPDSGGRRRKLLSVG